MVAQYSQVKQVEARLRARGAEVPFTSSTIPSFADVQSWLDEGEEGLNLALTGAGIHPPYSSSAVSVLGEIITTYAEGRARVVHAAAGGDGSNKDGESLILEFRDTLDGIIDDPENFSRRLGRSNDQTNGSPASYVTTGRHQKYGPVFKRGGKL